jgi:hypothetical protein
MVVTHWDTRPSPPNEWRRLTETYDVAKRILATSTRAREALLEMGVPDEKIIRMEMGVNTTGPMPPPTGIGAYRIDGTRVVRAEDLDEAIRAFPPLTKKFIRAELMSG